MFLNNPIRWWSDCLINSVPTVQGFGSYEIKILFMRVCWIVVYVMQAFPQTCNYDVRRGNMNTIIKTWRHPSNDYKYEALATAL